MDPILTVHNLTKMFGKDLREAQKMMGTGSDKDAIFKNTGVTIGAYDISFEVQAGDIFVIIGLSGSGKSTVVRCLNLLHTPTDGEILFEGQNIIEYSKKELRNFRRSRVAMVFQNFGLLSHRNVLENVAFGLEVRGMPLKERTEKAKKAIELVGLSGQEKRRIYSLSGGMKQRVGLARALANDPDILLMDEPFSALDPIVRRDMQKELLNIHKMVKKTIVFITHDINEAFKLGDRIAIMRSGLLVQCGTPEEILYNPADQYVRDFVQDIDKGKALCAWHVLIELNQPNLNTDLSKMENVFSSIPSVTIDTTLQEMLPLLQNRDLKDPIGITDYTGALVGYTTGKKVLDALV